jgi:peptidyl-prolyl cis-trans isomerase D
MFDLFRSRDKAVRILLGVILGVVALSMVTYLIPSGPGTGGTTGTGNSIAKVGDQDITVLTAQKEIQNALRGGKLPPQFYSMYVPRIIDSIITDRAMAYEAKRQGFKISDDDINSAIQEQLPPGFFQDGKLVKKDELEAALASQNMTIADMRNETERQLMVNRLRVIALEGTLVPQQAVEQEYRQRNEKVTIDYVVFNNSKFESQVKIDTPAEQDYYEKNKAMFRTPAKKNYAYLVFNPLEIAATIQISDADMRREYETNLDKFRIPERAQARHILIMTDEKKNNDAQSKAKAEGILKQLRGGADFADMAKKFSEDPGSGSKGGDLGWVTRGQMVKPFEDAVFSQKPGVIGDLVKTQYGYHIVEVTTRENAHVRSFEEVKPEIERNLRQQRVNTLTQQLADKAATDLRKDPSRAAAIAAEVKVPLQTADDIAPGSPLPGVGAAPELDQAASALNKNEVTAPIVIGGNRIVVAMVTGINPAHPSSFAEAEPQIRKALTAERLEALMVQKTSDLVAKTKAMNGDLKKAAASMGLEAKTSPELDRAASIEGIGATTSIAGLFDKPVGDIMGPITVQEQQVVLKILTKTEPDPAGMASQLTLIRNELKSKLARERNQIFEDGVRQALQKEGKIKIYQDVIDRIVAGFKTS